MNIQDAVAAFMRAAGQTTDRFNSAQATLYTGLQLEEMAEKIEAIAGGAVTTLSKSYLLQHADSIRILALEFKQGMHRGDIMRANPEALADADIDLAWVALGGAMSMCRDAPGAISEVARANHDKFPGGVALKDENGKVRKPADWRGPDLSPFIDASTES